MRTAFVSDNAFPWFNGGIEKRRFIIMQKLASSGNEVHCFTMRRPGMPRSSDFDYMGVRYHCVGDAAAGQRMYKKTGKRRSMRMPLRFSSRIFFAMLPYRFDVVDADSFPFLHLFPIWLYTRIRGVRFAISWHEVWSKTFWVNYLEYVGFGGYLIEWLCAHLADFNIANASTTRGLLIRELGAGPDRILVLPAAVDRKEILAFTSKRRPHKKEQFIVVSRLVRHKRVQLAIDAIAKTRARLLIVGTGPDEEELKRFAKEKAGGRVTFVRSVSTQRLFAEIQDSIALIMPSEREGLSLITLEALALGTPVVIANTSSLPVEVRRMCLEASEKRMGDLLKKMLASKKMYARLSEKTREKVLDTFSGDRADEVYDRIAGAKGF